MSKYSVPQVGRSNTQMKPTRQTIGVILARRAAHLQR